MPEEEPTLEGKNAAKSRKWIVVAVAGLVLILGSFLGAWAAGLLSGGGEGEASAEPGREVNEVINLEPIVVNVASDRKMAYARIGLALGLHNATPGVPLFNTQLVIPRIKDELLAAVGRMSMEELLLPETKQVLKEQVQAFVNGVIKPGSGRVVEVYITDFIVQ
jgi:flagellar basal body-associated protein FliL